MNYFFNEENFEFLKASEDVFNPGGDESLYPNATKIAPAELKKYQVAIFDIEKQKWNIVENHKGKQGYVNGELYEIKEYGPLPEGWSETPPEPTMEELKLTKKAELNKLRDEKETAGFIYNDRPFDSDMTSYNRLVGAHLSAQTALAMGVEFTPIPWTLQDNTTMLMTATDFLQIIPTFAGYSGMLHAKCNEFKTLVDEATTKEQLDLIVWE